MYCLSSSFCCVCLNVSPKLQDINQLDVDGLPFINKIVFVSFGHEAFDFKVVRFICPECTNSLRLAYKFKTSCLMNHELLRIYSGQLKYFTGNVSENGDLIVSLERLPERSEEEETPANKCEVNEENVEQTAGMLLRKMSPKKKVNKNVRLKCTACDAIFYRYIHLQVHYTSKHKYLFRVMKTKINLKESIVSYMCTTCSTKLGSLYALTKHLQTHVPKAVKPPKTPEPSKSARTCQYCETEVENNDTYKKHLVSNHADRASLRCHLCELTLGSDFEFRRHMFLEHTPRKCVHCDESFFNAELRAHVAAAHRAHKCLVCDKVFNHPGNLKRHAKSHEQTTAHPEPEIVKATAPPEAPATPEIPESQFVVNRETRKQCTNCLSIFSSTVSLQRHNCFKLKKMFQCKICFINYTKKSSFENHVKRCTLAANTPVPAEPVAETRKQSEPEAEPANKTYQCKICSYSYSKKSSLSNHMKKCAKPPTPVPAKPPTPVPAKHLTETSKQPEAEVAEQPSGSVEKVIKDENDLEIKEEIILDDFICNTTPLKQKNLEIGEVYSITELPETNLNETPNDKAKKVFPKIKLAEKSTVFANTENVEFSDSNDAAPVQVQITDPFINLQDAGKKEHGNKSVWVDSSDDSNLGVLTEPEKPVKLRRKSVGADQKPDLNAEESVNKKRNINELNETFTSDERTENVKRRRKSVWMESTSNDSTDTEQIGAKMAAIKGRRKSIYVNQSADLNSEPIVLKARRSVKVAKSRRMTICVTQESPKNTANEASDVNENIGNVDGTNDAIKLNSVPFKNTDFISSSCSSIQTFKLRKLRRKSICIDGQTPKIIDDLDAMKHENDANYISVRDVSDINNDISEQPN